MEKTYISSVAKDKNISRIALIGVPNEIGTSFRVFSLLAQNHINVDIILQGIGHEEGKDICFTVLNRTWSGPLIFCGRIRSGYGLPAWRQIPILPRFQLWGRE